MKIVLIKGAGEMASGTAHRLHAVGYSPVLTELPQPLAVRRRVSFAQAVYDGQIEVEGVLARKVESLEDAFTCCQQREIPVIIKEFGNEGLSFLRPVAVVDARLAKKNLGTKVNEAAVVIGLGPGFNAGIDVHAVIETNRGHDLGRVLYVGSAQADTGNPGDIGGYSLQRVLKVPVAGCFRSKRKIGELIRQGDLFGEVDGHPVLAPLDGVIRGLLMSGTRVGAKVKLGDIDPRSQREYCFTISDKARAIGGGVLEALLHLAGGVNR